MPPFRLSPLTSGALAYARVVLLLVPAGCAGGGPGPDVNPRSLPPVFGVTVYLDAEHGHPTYDNQLALCREGGISAVRCEGRLSAPGGVAAMLGPARELLDRAGTVLLAFNPEYARAYWPAAEGAFEKDLDALAAGLRGARARVMVVMGGIPAWEDGATAAGIRRALSRLRAPGRVVAWEIDAPVGPEGPPGGASDDPAAPAWRRPWAAYASAIAAAAASDLDAVAIRHFPNWEAGHGKRPLPLASYVDALRGILREVKARGRPALISEFGLADRDRRFAGRGDLIAVVARLVRDEGALGAYYYSLVGPDFGIWHEREWGVKWREATGPAR